MSDAVFPLCYFPPIPWFVAALQEPGSLSLELHQPYRKQQFSSRAHIRVPNRVMLLTIPVERRSARAALHQKRISYAEPWPHQHWQALRTSYGNSPFFEFFAPELEQLYQSPPLVLSELLLESTKLSIKWLGLDISLRLTEALRPEATYARDYRAAFDPSLRSLPPWFAAHPYPQVFGEFQAGLSILDLLCNLGGESRAYLLDNWQPLSTE
jgi:hypothetical protein